VVQLLFWLVLVIVIFVVVVVGGFFFGGGGLSLFVKESLIFVYIFELGLPFHQGATRRMKVFKFNLISSGIFPKISSILSPRSVFPRDNYRIFVMTMLVSTKICNH